MSEVRPFHGIRFNQTKTPDIAKVICPPYDIISPAEQSAIHSRSPYNVVRLEFGLDLPGDSLSNNKYNRAAETWGAWIRDGILQKEGAPSFYVHKHQFHHGDRTLMRTGLIACVRLEPWEKKVVLPHEHTGAKAKEDRLNLMRACRANISPILSFYLDPTGSVASILKKAQQIPPLLRADQENGEAHWLWNISNEDDTRTIESYFADRSIFIADGHHRYETALNYQQEVRSATTSGDKTGADYVMMTLVESSDPGLLILPQHRLVKCSGDRLLELKAKLQSAFKVESLPIAGRSAAVRAKYIDDSLSRHRKAGMAIGAVGLEKGKLSILREHQGRDYRSMMPAGRSSGYYRLEVGRLQHLVLDELEASKKIEVSYVPEESDVLDGVSSGRYQVGFLIAPLSAKDIEGIALAGDKVPRKSTYFFPKLPTGLVMRSLAEGL